VRAVALIDGEHMPEVVRDALAELPPNQQRAILLREWQGLTYREIADAAAIRSASVGRLLTRALNRLQRELDRRR
jgi:RNA polymerase sigma factor (sigma-70 family)